MPATSQGHEVHLQAAPSIEGLRFRRPDGSQADYAAMAAVIQAANRIDEDPWLPTPTNLREDLAGSLALDLARDVLVAEIDGSMVAVATAERRLRGGNGTYEVFGYLVPEQRRRGIGRAMLRANLQRVVEHGIETGDDFPLSVHGHASEQQVGHRALLEAAGFTVDRWFFFMRRTTLDDIPDAPLPDGLDVRPVRPADHRAIFDAEFEAFRDHWEPHDYDEAEFATRFRREDLDTDLWVVAWDGMEIAGVVQTWIWAEQNRQLGLRRGWLEEISVRRPWRRRGVARAITAEALRRLRGAGMTEAMLGVDSENPTGALGLYEGLGFEVAQRFSAYMRSVDR